MAASSARARTPPRGGSAVVARRAAATRAASRRGGGARAASASASASDRSDDALVDDDDDDASFAPCTWRRLDIDWGRRHLQVVFVDDAHGVLARGAEGLCQTIAKWAGAGHMIFPESAGLDVRAPTTTDKDGVGTRTPTASDEDPADAAMRRLSRLSSVCDHPRYAFKPPYAFTDADGACADLVIALGGARVETAAARAAPSAGAVCDLWGVFRVRGARRRRVRPNHSTGTHATARARRAAFLLKRRTSPAARRARRVSGCFSPRAAPRFRSLPRRGDASATPTDAILRRPTPRFASSVTGTGAAAIVPRALATEVIAPVIDDAMRLSLGEEWGIDDDGGGAGDDDAREREIRIALARNRRRRGGSGDVFDRDVADRGGGARHEAVTA